MAEESTCNFCCCCALLLCFPAFIVPISVFSYSIRLVFVKSKRQTCMLRACIPQTCTLMLNFKRTKAPLKLENQRKMVIYYALRARLPTGTRSNIVIRHARRAHLHWKFVGHDTKRALRTENTEIKWRGSHLRHPWVRKLHLSETSSRSSFSPS